MTANAAGKQRVRTVVTDLDNTLYDWFAMWGASFTAMLDVLLHDSGVPRDQLLAEIRAVHQKHHTSEYAFLIEELPSLRALHPNEKLTEVYDDAIRAYQVARNASLALYPGVAETLSRLKAAGCLVVGFTDSRAFYAGSRIRKLGLDGVLDFLFSPADHALPEAFVRSKPDTEYDLRRTVHEHVPPNEYKPNPIILEQILRDVGADKATTIYVGDSLMKDVAMAQDAGVTDVFAKYGAVKDHALYDLLRSVSHWSDEDVRREKEINTRGTVTASYTLTESMTELFDYFDFGE